MSTRDQLGPISSLFSPDEIECLVKTAAEAVHGNALGDDTLSSRQVEVSNRAYDALATEIEGGDLDGDRPAAVILRTGEPMRVLRFWDNWHQDLTVWAGDGAEDAAVAYLASYVRANWSNLADHTAVGEQPPASDRDAIRLFYGHPEKQPGQPGAEGYALSTEPVRVTW